MANKVFVDDTDQRVVYSGGWFIGGSKDEFGYTTHGTTFAGSTATFTFTGSSVTVFGTIPNRGAARNPTTSTYSIDGSKPVQFTASHLSDGVQYKQEFFHSPQLPQGQHTLTITSTTDNTFFWLDYFEVDIPVGVPLFRSVTGTEITPAPTQTPAMSTTTLTSFGDQIATTIPPTPPPALKNTAVDIDDTDNRIIYAGAWLLSGEPDENQATAHGSADPGATATLTFTGSSIAVYGTITETRPGFGARLSTYTIDGANPVVFRPSPAANVLYKQLFFQSPTLGDGQHTLVVTAGAGDLPLWLDFFQVNSSSSTPTTSFSSIIAPASSQPSDSSTHPFQLTSSGSSRHGGAIAGGVIGSLLFLGLVAFIVFRRRRKQPPVFVPTTPDPGWTPGPTWTNEKLTMRYQGGV
ncbi:hypothetical protein FPV67DRAFT_1782385 [Lyophyllum atratum]|nr:hypothetical protein FPV67DRAFT_1782385 [Lyophyllum atratum]